MYIRLDDGSLRKFTPRTTHKTDLQQFCVYCACSPYRALLFVPCEVKLEDVVGKVVDASLENEHGSPEFVRKGNQGKTHRKIVVSRAHPLAWKRASLSLADVLVNVPRDNAP